MAADDEELRDRLNAATRLALAGLAGAPAEALIDPLRRGGFVDWRPNGTVPPQLERVVPLEEFRASVRETAAQAPFPGLRLASRVDPGDSAVAAIPLIRDLLRQPAYRTAGRFDARKTGLAALSFGPEGGGGQGGGAAFSWPLRIVANESTLEALHPARAVRRGLVRLVHPLWVHNNPAPRIVAHLIDCAEPGLAPRLLALRFAAPGHMLARLRKPFTLDQLDWQRATILFPLERLQPAVRLSDFVEGLARNLPLDLAAWQASQQRGEPSPLVVAPRDLLARSCLVDTIPALRRRLQKLQSDTPLAVELRKLRGLGIGSRIAAPIQAQQLLQLLDRRTGFAFERRADAAEGLAAISQAIDEIRPDPPFVARDRGGSGGGMARRIEPSADPPLSWERWRPKVDSQIPRYTDVSLTDSYGSGLTCDDPLIRERRYKLKVAIRTHRMGLTSNRRDQWGFFPKQKGTADIWVVITDESEAVEEGVTAATFEFSQRFAKIEVPEAGDSVDSAHFAIVPHLARGTKGVGRIGIRLYHKLILIDHLQLSLRIGGARRKRGATDPPAIRVLLKSPRRDAGIERLDPQSRARALTISISRAAGEGNYLFAFVRGAGGDGVPTVSGTKKLSESELDAYLAEFRDALLDLAFGPALGAAKLSPDACAAFLTRVAALGSRIVVALFDYQQRNDFYRLGEMVREVLGEAPIVQIALSDDVQDFVFPWQILSVEPRPSGAPADPENFWGYRFVIEAKRCGDGFARPSRPATPSAPVLIHYARWNFASEKQHLAKLRSFVAAANARGNRVRIVAPPIDSKEDFVAALRRGGGDLLYVYAHGASAAPATPSGHKLSEVVRSRIDALARRLKAAEAVGLPAADLEEARRFHSLLARTLQSGSDAVLVLTRSTITLTDLTLAIDTLAHAPIVFVNTCESAQIWNAIPSSFVGLLLGRGARAVLGTEATVPVALADLFGECVLGRLFAGEPIGEAVRDARRRVLLEHNNPLGLAYTLYGAADARLFSTGGEAR